MHYYIDGYNLMFRIVRAGDDLTAQRELLIRDLSQKISFLEIDATIVFDSQYQVGESTRSHSEALTIYFTEQGQTADDFILEEIRSSPNPLEEVVVTSDKRLAWRFRRKLGKSETVEEFIKWLNKRYKNKIRQIREEKKHPPQAVEKPPEKKVRRLPQKNVSVDQCFEYYLELFEKEFTELPPLHPIQETKATEVTAKKKKKKIEKDPRTEMERWYDIFQSRLE